MTEKLLTGMKSIKQTKSNLLLNVSSIIIGYWIYTWFVLDQLGGQAYTKENANILQTIWTQIRLLLWEQSDQGS